MGPKIPTSRGCILSVLFGASKRTQCCSICRGRSPPGRHMTTDCHRWAVFCLAGRDSDPHWLKADPDTNPDPAFFLIADPDPGSGSRIPDPDPGSRSRVWWSKIGKNLQLEIWFLFFWSKLAIYLSLGLHKGRLSYRRSLQSSKENIQHFKRWKFCPFSIFLGHFALLDPDPQFICGSGSSSSN
jgi:hypothetical protein